MTRIILTISFRFVTDGWTILLRVYSKSFTREYNNNRYFIRIFSLCDCHLNVRVYVCLMQPLCIRFDQSDFPHQLHMMMINIMICLGKRVRTNMERILLVLNPVVDSSGKQQGGKNDILYEMNGRRQQMNTFALEMKAVVDVDNDEEEMVVSG